jgi:RNA polymerase sigma-70 factor (ECF subfamily)
MDRELELALVERVRAGDTAAFDAIHAAFNPRLYGFLARLTRSRDVAEDLLEDTWLRFVSHADQLRPDTRLAPGSLPSRATCTSPGAGRGRWRRERRPRWTCGRPPAAGASPFEQAATSELERRIEHALASLSVDAREVLLLVGAEGMTPSEAAAVCGISPEAMRQRLKRARAALSERLADSEERPIARLREVKP